MYMSLKFTVQKSINQNSISVYMALSFHSVPQTKILESLWSVLVPCLTLISDPLRKLLLKTYLVFSPSTSKN